MSKLFWIGLLAGAYYLYKSAHTVANTTVGALPSDATLVQQQTVLGYPINIYLAASGYYATVGGTSKILGPYSQAQVAALLQAKTGVSTLLASL